MKDDIGCYETRDVSVADDKGALAEPIRYAFRTLDRQWLPTDARLLNDPRPKLWAAHSSKQVYLTAPEDRTPTAGPALSISGLIPDLHHYHGRGGRVYPLWRDAAASQPNVRPDLLETLTATYGREVAPEDVMAYLAAVMAHPAFTQRFQKDLVRPGLRVPVTASADVFFKAAALGREVVWLHTYGERFADPKAGRPSGPPRLPKGQAPVITREGEIPSSKDDFPNDIDHDAAKKRLLIGKGYVDNVTPEVWTYEVSGMRVVKQWFSYRKRDRRKPLIGDKRPPSPLCDIQPEHWPHEYTSDLIDLLNVLGRLVLLEPEQAALLEEILAGHLIDREALSAEKPLENTAASAVS